MCPAGPGAVQRRARFRAWRQARGPRAEITLYEACRPTRLVRIRAMLPLPPGRPCPASSTVPPGGVVEIDSSLLQPRGGGPFEASAAGCGGYVSGVTTSPGSCHARPVWAGVVYFPAPRPALWWAFACDAHVECLHAPRRLLERDRAELARRRKQRALGLAGRPYERTPLAVGWAAEQRVARAVAQHTAATDP